MMLYDIIKAFVISSFDQECFVMRTGDVATSQRENFQNFMQWLTLTTLSYEDSFSITTSSDYQDFVHRSFEGLSDQVHLPKQINTWTQYGIQNKCYNDTRIVVLLFSCRSSGHQHQLPTTVWIWRSIHRRRRYQHRQSVVCCSCLCHWFLLWATGSVTSHI